MCRSDASKYFYYFFKHGKVAENLNNVTHEKEEENIGNLRKISFFSSIMKTVALITLDFISRDMNKDDMTKTLLEFALNPLVLGEMGQNPGKKALTSFSRKHVFAQLPHRSRNNSVSFSPNHFKFSVIGPN